MVSIEKQRPIGETPIYQPFNFPRTLRARLGFAGLIAMLFGHRTVNRDWQGMRGLVDGLRDVWRKDLSEAGPR